MYPFRSGWQYSLWHLGLSKRLLSCKQSIYTIQMKSWLLRSKIERKDIEQWANALIFRVTIQIRPLPMLAHYYASVGYMHPAIQISETVLTFSKAFYIFWRSFGSFQMISLKGFYVWWIIIINNFVLERNCRFLVNSRMKKKGKKLHLSVLLRFR